MSECPAGIVGGECDERPSGACDADGPDLCMAYWRFAEGKQRARAEAAEKRVAELERELAAANEDAERLADTMAQSLAIECRPGCIEALAAHEALRGTK